MKHHLRTGIGATIVPLVLSLFAASCSDAALPKPLAITPQLVDGLTCESYDFAVADATKTVTWSVNPAGGGAGTIDATGHYTAPTVIPKEPVVIVAQSDGSEGHANIVLHTAHPTEIGQSDVIAHDIEQRSIAISGQRVYAAVLDANNNVIVARSDNGGKVFEAGVTAGNMPSGVKVGCVSVAIDAGNPDVVYVTYQAMENGGAFAKTTDVDTMSAGSTIALAVSEDKGATFTNYVLVSQNNEGYCTDLASPAANTISLIVPTDDGDTGTGDDLHVYTYVDGNRGKGFSAGKIDGMYAYRVDEQYTPFYMQAIKKIQTSGGTDGLESPSLFTNHKDKLCAVYWTDTQMLPHVYPIQVECSTDSGKTYGAPSIVFDPATKGDGSLTPLRPRGAISDDGRIAVIWAESDENVFVSTSADGKTWSAPTQVNTHTVSGSAVKGHHPTIAWNGGTLWIAYQVDSGGANDPIIVDKSCDGGTAWSGNEVVNEISGGIADRKYPLLHISDTGPVLTSNTASEDANIVFTTLTP